MPPELPDDQKAIDRMVETDIDHAIEQKRLECMVCEAGELDINGYCGSCGAKTDI